MGAQLRASASEHCEQLLLEILLHSPIERIKSNNFGTCVDYLKIQGFNDRFATATSSKL
jgi:hypothetical protein